MSLSSSTHVLVDNAGLDSAVVEELARSALAEDLGGADGVDITSAAVVDPEVTSQAVLVTRAAGVVAGLPWAAAVFDCASDGALTFTPHIDDAVAVVADTPVASVQGPIWAILTAERSALNIVCRASGVASHTFLWAQALAGTGATVLDTRKTSPGLRSLEKYAVRCGGGKNKRFGLFDAAMIKDNHIRAAGSLTAAFSRLQDAHPDVPVEVEVQTLAEAQEAMAAGATYLLCDNMPVEQLREVVQSVRAHAGDTVQLEATGGLTLDNARTYADTGVDFLSVGALTHSSPIVDISVDLSGAA